MKSHDCFQIVVHAFNATMGPEGICPMFLVCSALHRHARVTQSSNQDERQNAVEEANNSVMEEQENRLVSLSQRHPGRPQPIEVSQNLWDIPAGAPASIFIHYFEDLGGTP